MKGRGTFGGSGSASVVTGFGPGFFRLGDALHQGPLLLHEDARLAWQGLEDLEPILALAGRIDLLVLGSGREMAHPPADMADALAAAGIGIEPSATPVALRTHSLLLADGRRIALAALPV